MELIGKGNSATRWMFLIIELGLILNSILIPKLVVIYIFTGLYIFIIYRRFAHNGKSFAYFSTVLFSLVFLSLYMPLGSKMAVYYFYISVFLYYIISVIQIVKNQKQIGFIKKKKNKYLTFLAVFAVYLLISFFIAVDKMAAANTIFIYSVMLLFMVMMIIENKEEKRLPSTFRLLEYIYIGILFLGTIELFGIKYGLRNHFLDYGISFSNIPYTQRIPVVFFYNPNNFAVFLVLGMIALFISVVFEKDKRRKIYLLILYFISQINLVFTTGRISWLALMIVLIFTIIIICLLKIKDIRKPIIGITVCTMLMFFILSLIPFMSPYYGKFAMTVHLIKNNITSTAKKPSHVVKLGSYGSINERYTILYDVIEGVFLKGNIMGFGPGNTSNYIKALNNTHGVVNIHSLLFEILGDFGIPMCLYVIYIYINATKALIRKAIINRRIIDKYAFIYMLCFLGFMLLSFAPSTVITFTPFWMMVGLGVGRIVNNEKVEFSEVD